MPMIRILLTKLMFSFELTKSNKPTNQNDIELFPAYLTQLRQKVGHRVCEKVFGDDGKPSGGCVLLKRSSWISRCLRLGNRIRILYFFICNYLKNLYESPSGNRL